MSTTDLVPVLAIDGPSGSGKGTVGQTLAAQLGWHFLDSGTLYRAVALLAQRQGGDMADESILVRIAQNLDIRFEIQGHAQVQVMFGGEEVGTAIRSEEISALASQVAAVPGVRRALMDKQRALRRSPGLVADGRDMGTVVFPDATLKIYLTASPETRAERRYKQLKHKGLDVNLARLAEEIRARDARDAQRDASPLKPADDAQIMDTTSLTVAQVVHQILGLLRERLGASGC